MKFPANLEQLGLKTSPATASAYAELSFDHNPLHLDADFAATTPFGAPIAHGMMALNLLLQAIEKTFEAERIVEHLDIRFSAPVKVGEEISAGGMLLADNSDTYEVWVQTEDGTAAIKGTLRIETA